MNIQTFLKRPWLAILLIWAFATAINIQKPFQGDDGFHLEAAKHIVKDPLHPMSGIIRWDRPEPEPMYKANQPPLLFFMIAGVSLIAGFNEVPMHLLTAVFSFLALFWFYKIAVLYQVKRPVLLVALLGLCPAFVVNQNIMTDIPLLALLLGMVYNLLLAEKSGYYKYNIIAILMLTAGLFIKYSFLPVAAAVAAIFYMRKQYKNLRLLLIPVFCLILWSIWNYLEFGGFHLLQRSTTPLFSRWNMLWSYFACLGSIATISLFSLNYLLKGRLKMSTLFFLTALFLLVTIYSYYTSSLENKTLNRILEFVFFFNGLIILWPVLQIVRGYYKEVGQRKFMASNEGLFTVLALFLSVFMILLAPFMASRHILLVLPFIMLLSAPIFERFTTGLVPFSIITALLFSLILGISDWQFAAFYRDAARELKKSAPPQSRLWASGTGGWQWYARQNGIMEYTVETADIKPGDFLFVPRNLSHYRVDSKIQYTLITKIWGNDINLLSYINARESSMYRTLWGMPTWSLSRKPIDTVYVLQCTGLIEP